MKKILLIFFLIISLSMTLISCGGTQPPEAPDENGEGDSPAQDETEDPVPDDGADEFLDVGALGYRVISTANSLNTLKSKLVKNVKNGTGVSLLTPEGSAISKITDYEILLGTLNSRYESYSEASGINDVASERISVAVLKVSGTKIVINGSDNVAINHAIEKLCEYIKDGAMLVPKNLNYRIVFDRFVWADTDEFVPLDESRLSEISTIGSISVDDSKISGLNSVDAEFHVETNFLRGYPTVSAEGSVKGSSVSIVQATNENGGIATISVTSADGSNQSEYKVVFDMNYHYDIGAEVVIKNGAKAVVTFVVDDGDLNTARFVYNQMGAKYSRITASFAVITQKLASLKMVKDENGDLVYEKDENGRYVYTEIKETCDFWRDVIASRRFEAVSHSHTHSYWGDDDGGGFFTYQLNDGTTAYSQEFPKGNVTKELSASNQILEDLGARGLTYIKPGVGAKLSDYYFSLLESGAEYIGARTTYTNPTKPTTMLNYASTFKSIANRYSVKAYMVEHYNTDGTTDNKSTTAQCHAATIKYWKDYIDAALDNNAWACFCIHNIVEDTYDATRGGHFTYQSQIDELFGYVDAFRDDVWCATFTDAMIYYNEWSTAKIDAIAYKYEYIDATLTHEEIGECYNMALTVKLNVPASWTSAVANGTTYEIMHDEASGNSYIMIDLVPGVTVRVTGE